MGGTSEDLQKVVATTVAAFNAKNIYNKGTIFGVEQYLDASAIVYSSSHHLGHHPKHAALAYLATQVSDNPEFVLPNFPIVPVLNGPDGAATAATLTGRTKWIDDNHRAPKGEQVIFNFTFIWDATKGWLFSTLWAADLKEK